MMFYLGTAWPVYLERTDVPLCVSILTLKDRKTLPRARGRVLIDGGGFTQIGSLGYFELRPKQHARLNQKFMDEIGNIDGAAIQDYMCEAPMLKKTGLTVADHQRLTCESFSELRYLAPDVPWVPVLQGYYYEDYLRHLDMYSDFGDDLTEWPLVGVGSICRRQATKMVEGLLVKLNSMGLRLHGFGLKELALRNIGAHLHSADSMAWSKRARFENFKMPDCTHRRCTNCIPNALRWREKVVTGVSKVQIQAFQIPIAWDGRAGDIH
jgi:hypothetical protein